MPADEVVNFLFEGTKEHAGDEDADPKRISWKTQIIDGEHGPDIALEIENLFNIADSVAGGHCNPDKAEQMRKVLRRFPAALLCGVDASSSRGGRLLQTLMEERKVSKMEYHEKGQAKKAGEKFASLFGQSNDD